MRHDRILRSLQRHRFVVTMLDEQAWDGLIMEVDDSTVVLRDAVALIREGSEIKRVPADCEVLLPRPRIAYMQRVYEVAS